MDPKTVRAIFKTFQNLNPEPTTELVYHSPFELLVAVILSAQATDKSVNLATRELFKVAKTPEAIVKMGLKTLESHIKTIGLYKNKAKFVLETSKRLIDDFGSQVPSDRDALESLPGVGRKTANVILNTCFHVDCIAVDTHILRISKRIGLSHASTPLGVEHDLIAIIPKPYLRHAHHWLILHGRYICTARKPACYKCPIANYCEFPDKTVL